MDCICQLEILKNGYYFLRAAAVQAGAMGREFCLMDYEIKAGSIGQVSDRCLSELRVPDEGSDAI